jgi:hypothetical protein
MPTRRRFLAKCSTLAVTASIVPSVVLEAGSGRKYLSLDQIRYDDFAAQLKSYFLAYGQAASPVAVRLVEARRLAPHALALANAADAQNEKFSLLFSGPLSKPLAQNTYTFEHQRIGRFSLFIVPIGHEDRSRLYYEATFNRPVSAEFRERTPVKGKHLR